MDEQLKAFLEDIVAVWHKHGLSFYPSYTGMLAINEFSKGDVETLPHQIEDERIEVCVKAAAEAERKRLEYERDHAEEIAAAREIEKERRKEEEDYALAFIARARERQKLIKR